MRVLGRRRRRHRAARAGQVQLRGSVLVELPGAPTAGGGLRPRPAPLTLPVTEGGPAWAFPAETSAAFLAAVDAAAPGAVLDVQQGGGGEHALLAAVYTTRPVRVLAPDAARAHAIRQAAASNALPVVVEERALTGTSDPGGTGETLDRYVERTALEPIVLRLADPHAAPGLLAGAARLLAHRRPWVVLGAGSPPGHALPAQLADLGYTPVAPGVLAPTREAAEAFEPRSRAWLAALAAGSGMDDVVDVVDLRDPADAVS